MGLHGFRRPIISAHLVGVNAARQITVGVPFLPGQGSITESVVCSFMAFKTSASNSDVCALATLSGLSQSRRWPRRLKVRLPLQIA